MQLGVFTDLGHMSPVLPHAFYTESVDTAVVLIGCHTIVQRLIITGTTVHFEVGSQFKDAIISFCKKGNTA